MVLANTYSTAPRTWLDRVTEILQSLAKVTDEQHLLLEAARQAAQLMRDVQMPKSPAAGCAVYVFDREKDALVPAAKWPAELSVPSSLTRDRSLIGYAIQTGQVLTPDYVPSWGRDWPDRHAVCVPAQAFADAEVADRPPVALLLP